MSSHRVLISWFFIVTLALWQLLLIGQLISGLKFMSDQIRDNHDLGLGLILSIFQVLGPVVNLAVWFAGTLVLSLVVYFTKARR